MRFMMLVRNLGLGKQVWSKDNGIEFIFDAVPLVSIQQLLETKFLPSYGNVYLNFLNSRKYEQLAIIFRQ